MNFREARRGLEGKNVSGRPPNAVTRCSIAGYGYAVVVVASTGELSTYASEVCKCVDHRLSGFFGFLRDRLAQGAGAGAPAPPPLLPMTVCGTGRKPAAFIFGGPSAQDHRFQPSALSTILAGCSVNDFCGLQGGALRLALVGRYNPSEKLK